MVANVSLVPASPIHEPDDYAQSIFGTFLQSVTQKLLEEKFIWGGSLVWLDEPVETYVLSGTWPIMEKIANLSEETLVTAAQVKIMAERVNRLVSAGMLIVYKTPENAAEAFFKDVIVVTRTAHALGYQPGMKIPLSGWKQLVEGNRSGFLRQIPRRYLRKPGSLISYAQSPSTLFFARLVKEARALRDRVAHRSAELKKRDISSYNDGTRICRSMYAYEVRGRAKNVLSCLSETDAAPFLFETFILTIEEELKLAEKMLEIFESFDVSFVDWPISDFFISVDEHWLRTQMILSFTTASPRQEAIFGTEQYCSGLARLQKAKFKDVYDQVRYRLEHRVRRSALTQEQWDMFAEVVQQTYDQMCKWSAEYLHDEVMKALLIEIPDRELFMDSKQAFAIAANFDLHFFEHAARSSRFVETQSWYEHIGLSIHWGELSEDEVRRIVEGEVLPISTIIKGLLLCEPSIQTMAVAAIMDQHRDKGTLDAEDINALIAQDLLEINFDVLKEFVEEIEPSLLDDRLAAILRHAKEKGEQEAIVTFWKALGRASSDVAQAFVQNKRYRFDICHIGMDVFGLVEQSWGDYKKVAQNLGTDLYNQMIMGSLAVSRHYLRRDEPDEHEQPWNELFSQKMGSFPIPIKVFAETASLSDIQNMFQHVTEQQVLNWVGMAQS